VSSALFQTEHSDVVSYPKGKIEYNGDIKINASLLSVVLHD
jgi:hypothetical protein